MTILGNYQVLCFTLNGVELSLDQYRHDAPFVEGDTRTIQYDDTEPIAQTFYGDTETGGWYDEE